MKCASLKSYYQTFNNKGLSFQEEVGIHLSHSFQQNNEIPDPQNVKKRID